MRVTFDSNVFVSALKYQGPPARLLELAAVEAFHLRLSASILDETKRILSNKFRWPVIPHVQLDLAKHDPDGSRILECAQSSGSDYIVTGGNDLLDLKYHAGTRILRPAEFLMLLEAR